MTAMSSIFLPSEEDAATLFPGARSTTFAAELFAAARAQSS